MYCSFIDRHFFVTCNHNFNYFSTNLVSGLIVTCFTWECGGVAVLPANISGQNKKYIRSKQGIYQVKTRNTLKVYSNTLQIKRIIFQIYIVGISVIYWKYIRPNTFLAGSGEKEYLYNWFIRRNIF